MSPVHASYRPGIISGIRIRRPGRDHLLTVILMQSGFWTVNPSKAAHSSRFPVTVWVKYAVPPWITSTVKVSGTPSKSAPGKYTLHACRMDTLEKLSCTQGGSVNVPSSPLSTSPENPCCPLPW